MPNQYTPAVRRGMDILDDYEPGWRKQINLAQLNLNDCNQCILGQLFSDYFTGRDILHFDLDDAVRHGFTIGDAIEESLNAQWAALTDAWLEELRKEPQT